jgi:hypothetical protein
MKRLTIIGDSNACGEWAPNPYYNPKDIIGSSSIHNKLHTVIDSTITSNDFFYRIPTYLENSPLIEVHPGIESYLNDMGHACFNLGMGGNTNIKTLIDLENSLLLRLPRIKTGRFVSPQYIIWMITEPLRDLEIIRNEYFKNKFPEYFKSVSSLVRQNRNNIKKLNESLMDYTFQIAENIYQHTGIPFILIEGFSITYDLEKKYNFCHSKVNNWMGDIVGMTPPILATNQVFHLSTSILEKSISANELDELIINQNNWTSMCHNCKDLSDKVHPTREKHKELAIKINDLIMMQKNYE